MGKKKTPENIVFKHLSSLSTEQRNTRSVSIDLASPLQITRIINEEDRLVSNAVGKRLPEIAQAIETVIKAFKSQGRLFYMGSGTSGRIGVVDAAECPPTFGTPPEMVQGLIAGGKKAMFQAQEGVEDLPQKGESDLKAKRLNEHDVVCGLAASGRTPYVLGGLNFAHRMGASTLLVCCVSASELPELPENTLIIDIPVGPEVITGSTRMKSASAQKMVCNMITTGAMIGLGKIYENVMVDLQTTNQKLQERAKGMVMNFTGLDYQTAQNLLFEADGHVKAALVMHHRQVDLKTAKLLLDEADGSVRRALAK